MVESRIRASALAVCASLLLGSCGKGPIGRRHAAQCVLRSRRASSTRTSTPPSRSTGSRPPARTCASASRMAAPAARRAPSSTGLPADVVTLALAGDIDTIAAAGQTAAAQLGTAPAAQQRAVRLHHRVPRARRQPEEHPRLGRSRARRRAGDHAESQDLRRRALELPRAPGPGPRSSPAAARRARASSCASSTRTCRCSTPARAAH